MAKPDRPSSALSASTRSTSVPAGRSVHRRVGVVHGAIVGRPGPDRPVSRRVRYRLGVSAASPDPGHGADAPGTGGGRAGDDRAAAAHPGPTPPRDLRRHAPPVAQLARPRRVGLDGPPRCHRARRPPGRPVRRLRPGELPGLPDRRRLRRAVDPDRRGHPGRPLRQPVGRHGARAGDGHRPGGADRRPQHDRPGKPHRRATSRSTSAATSRPAPTSTSPTRTTATRTRTRSSTSSGPTTCRWSSATAAGSGTGVVVLPGTELGRNTVVAAGAVVRGTFPDHCVLAGVPAKIVRRYVPGSGWVTGSAAAVPEDTGSPD